MDKIKKYQKEFVAAITTSFSSEELIDNIIPVGKLNIQGVLDVYKRDYIARLTEAIGETFETTWAVLGDEDFLKLCGQYISQTPSEFRELGEYSRGFAEFLKKMPFEDYPFLNDLLDYELAFWELFHRENKTHEIIENFSIDDLLEKRIVFAQNMKVFSWDYKIFELWKLRKVGLSDLEADIYEAQRLILFKTTSFVQVCELTSAQRSILERLLKGEFFGDILEEVEITGEEISDLFFKLNSNKLIRAFV